MKFKEGCVMKNRIKNNECGLWNIKRSWDMNKRFKHEMVIILNLLDYINDSPFLTVYWHKFKITSTMVEPGEAKVKAEKGQERKYPTIFKKNKHGKNNNTARGADQDWDMPELLKGVEFSMAKNGLDLWRHWRNYSSTHRQLVRMVQMYGKVWRLGKW